MGMNRQPGTGRGRARARGITFVLLVAAALSGGAASAATAATPDPVLLVHGWNSDPAVFADLIARFNAAGRTATAIDLATDDNIKNAAQIRDLITARGWTRVDLVAQSMGGLSARHYVKFLGPSVVDTYTSLGAPQYGIYPACLLPSGSGGQMCPWSGFLANLNRGDDTPPGAGTRPVYWTTIYSASDGIVSTSSSRLDGGACHVYENPGTGHNEMDNDPITFTHILAATNRSCAGTFK
jgi:triacylglycerol lipase